MGTMMEDMGMLLRERIAATLGWTVQETMMFSIPTLREMVRGKSEKLTHECTLFIASPAMVRR